MDISKWGFQNRNLVYFNQPYAAEALEYGREYCFYGTLRGDYSRTQMQNPLFEPVERQGSVTRCIVPVYSLAAGISPQLLRRTIGLALSACLPTLPEVLPRSVLESQGLMGAREAYQMIHNPPSMDALEAARRRIVFEEFFLFTVGLLQLRASRRAESTPPMKNLSLARFLEALPFAPTAAQRRAVEEITRQLTAVQNGDWEDWEQQGALQAMLSSLTSLPDSQSALENYYLGQIATDCDETPEQLARALREVTKERIMAAAQSARLDTVYFLHGKEEA